MSRQWILRGLSLAAACCTLTLIWNGAARSNQIFGSPGTLDTPKPHKDWTAKLGGEKRYLTFISTDKPIYKTGDRVYIRGVLLNAATHRPMTDGFASATISIKGPKGDVIASGMTQTLDSVWGFSWAVPQDQAGGEYTVQVTYPWDGHAPCERKFDVRAYRAPRLKSQITFLRDGYGPGDMVKATLDVKRAEGGIPEGAKVSVTAIVDGKQINGGTAKVGADGLCHVSLALPPNIPRGEGTLALVIEDGGVVETASKTIPIIMQTVDLQTFPEGGDLVAGFKNRVYLQAKQPDGKPADLSGDLVIDDGAASKSVSAFHTEHEGRGRFEFTPDANKHYYLTISSPHGIKTHFKLPDVKSTGAVIHTDKDIYTGTEPVSLTVGCTAKSFRVTLSKHETEIAACKFESNTPNSHLLHSVRLDVPSHIDGVLTATVWNEDNVPIAERLIFREPASPLHISITPDKTSYVPGDKAQLKIKVTNADGQPISALVGMNVTDDSVLEMIDKREQAPRLPAMVLLEPEVDDLADAHVYLDSKNPKAPIATDLLLGTQGWRRFAFIDLAKFMQAHGDKARRAVALKIQLPHEVRRAMKLQAAVPPPPMPGAPMLAPAPLAAHARWFRNPNELMIIDERPVIHDFRAVAMGGFAPAGFAPANRPGAPVMLDNIGDKDRDLRLALESADKTRQAAAIVGNGYYESGALTNIVVVREYAHSVRPNRKSTDRADFTDTLYWNAGVKTNAKTGEATISFGLNDNVTTFRAFADGFSDSGALGSSDVALNSVQPFYAEAKLPLEVSSGDRILLPVSLVNATHQKLDGSNLNISLKGDSQISQAQLPAGIASGERRRVIEPINIGVQTGDKNFVLVTKAGSYEDRVERKLSIKPKGFPMETSFGGQIEPGKVVNNQIVIPRGVIPQSFVTNCALYPTPLANMTEAMERLIQDPYGCFEQTSSTSYPLTMAQQYFLTHSGVDPRLVARSREKLDKGYNQLVSFWCPDRGYEWFGENPGHEALTAFGLLHFADMSKVRNVDQKMVATTRAWLLKQKDGHGGFNRKRRSLHSWIEDKDCSNAYIAWALLESGQPASDLKLELQSLKKAANASTNSYVVALAANALYLSGDKDGAKQLMHRLAAKQIGNGSVSGVTSSIVGSDGETLEIEGTALATLAWLRDSAFSGNVEKSIKYLADACKGGRYGSTQSTVLALRAIVKYDEMHAKPKQPGKVRIAVDGQPVGDWITFNKSSQGAIKLPSVSELLTPGTHRLELRMEGGGRSMPYNISVKYNAVTPNSSNDCKVALATELINNKMIEGGATEVHVTITNKTNQPIPSPVAIIGLPGGLEPRHDQLKELVKSGKIDAYEVKGREVVLYWRSLPESARVQIPLSVIAAVPGSYEGPASRAYLYYSDENKQWLDGLKVEIAAK